MRASLYIAGILSRAVAIDETNMSKPSFKKLWGNALLAESKGLDRVIL